MFKIEIICIGKLKENYFKDAEKEYLKRITRFAEIGVTELPEYGYLSEAKAKETEGENILKAVNSYMFALDGRGRELSSEYFSLKLEGLKNTCSKAAFVIGGSDGLAESVIQKADFLLSFGKFTYPRQLMRVMLSEQIYRALTISNNIAYHK